METLEGKAIATEDTSPSSTESGLLLSILNDDVVWEILVLLSGRDLVFVHIVVPQWRHITSKLLKRPVYGTPIHWHSTPIEWLTNENLHEWKLVLELPNLMELSLDEAESLGVAQAARLLECIPRLCKNLKVLYFRYSDKNIPMHGFAEMGVTIDLSQEVYMFPWIPGWPSLGWTEIILSSKMLEPQSKISSDVLDYVKSIFVKFKSFIRDPYWFSMKFERRQLIDVTTNTSIYVARLQSITLGICESKTNVKQIMEQWWTLGTYATAVCRVFVVDDGFPKAIETTCSVLRQLEEPNYWSRPFKSLWRSHHINCTPLQYESRRENYKCRCCACWSAEFCQDIKYRYCGYCSSKLAWYEWNTYWMTEYKFDWNYDWSKLEDWNYDKHGRYDGKIPKYENPSDDSVMARMRDILDSFC